MKKYFFILLTLFAFLSVLSACDEDIVIPGPEGPYNPVPIPDPDTLEYPLPGPDTLTPEPNPEPIPNPEPVPTPEPIPGNGSVPADKVGNWVNNLFSFDEFWHYDGTYAGKIYENSRAFVFGPNGEADLYVVWIQRPTIACKVEAYSHYKGTVVFDEANSTFTFTPTSGTYRGFYNCAPSANVDRPATEEELAKNITTYYYHMEDVGGINYMVVKFSPTDAQGSYFKLVN